MKIPSSPVYNMLEVLGSEIKIQKWNIFGLPRDTFSIENAIIMDSSKRWSLFIDPQSQANKWIRSMEKSNDLEVLKLTQNYIKRMEVCIEYGRPVLIECILEDLDAPLDPILMKQTFMQGAQEYIALGENVIEYNQNFRLYMTSKLRNPHYLPEVFNKVTIVNFALTLDGLEDQLLGIVVAKERPDLQAKRDELIVQSAANKKALKEIEDMILNTLSSSTGNILEDETAVDVLDSSKALSTDIQLKQDVARETEDIIEKFRQSYRPVAKHSAGLYYCITDLPNVDPMYQYSLTWFINIYVMSIQTAKMSSILETRLKYLADKFTFNLYSNVCRSLFEKDKLVFSFIMCCTMMMAQSRLSNKEFTFFITGGVSLDNPHPNPGKSWLQENSWNEICRVEDIEAFKGFQTSFKQNVKVWEAFYDMTEPQNSPLPEPWESKLNMFQRLIVIRMIRPDKVIHVMRKLIEDDIGQEYIVQPPFDIEKSFDDSNCLSPLIFILSPGTDPMQSLLQFSQKKGQNNKFQSISLGQGQGPIAKALIEEAKETGGWVCLQNCHLATSWMPTLEKICEDFDVSNTKLDFRLWLTSYPSSKFPASILQNSVKMTNEPPTGLQANLMRSYTSDPVKDPQFYEGCPGKEKIFSKLLYGIAFFHAVILERKSFGPIGWNIPYGFNESDFQISVMQLQMYVNEYSAVPYEAVSYLTGECNYGGRVTDDWDRRCLNTILSNFINPSVVLDPNYLFAQNNKTYCIPIRYEYEEFIKLIQTLPAIPSPEVYGLHDNSGITKDLKATRDTISTIILVQQSGGSTSGGSDQIVSAICDDIISKLPPNLDLEKAMIKFPVDYSESMNTVLCQEMERFNRLLSIVRNTMLDIRKAIKGEIVLTSQLEVAVTELVMGKFPSIWAKFSYPSLKPLGSYITDFVDRLQFFQSWFDKGVKPSCFWLSGFFFIQAFLTGAMQNFARKYKVPIDQLTFDFLVQKFDRSDKAPTDGVYCYGLYLDGARWGRQKGQLEEQYPKILNDYVPIIWFLPIKKVDLKIDARYICPLYKTSERRGTLSTTGHSTNYVIPLLLTTEVPSSHWVKRGVAMLCQLSN